MAVDPVSAAAAAIQTTAGIIQTISASAKLKKLLARRTSYTTPDEIFKILQATQSRASGGYDPFTLNYLTNQTDRAFDQATGTAARLGANPNDLSALFDQKMQGIMKIGAENHQLNMANFSKYLGALDVVAANKTAEWRSREDMLKDEIQSAAAEKAAGIQNIGGGVNAGISTSAASQTENLYKQIAEALKELKKGRTAGTAGTGGNSTYDDVSRSVMGVDLYN